MRLKQKTTRFKTNINAPQQEFKIRSSEKAFRILSNQLYSNKVRAVIRELCTNAYDAHVYANKADTPFYVHLPNQDSPEFVVKDCGPGLSEEDVYNLYTTYFDSNKTESNDYVGALGLGSKSPFAYTDTFFVKSRYGGEEIHYTCFLSGKGIPSVMEVSRRELEPGESTGVTVYLSVNVVDNHEFYREARTALRPFDPVPKIGGSDDFEIEERGELIDETDTLCFYCKGPRENCVNVLHGCVEYPVDVSQLNQVSIELDIKDIPPQLQILIKAPLGSLEVAPNREALSYDPDTVKSLLGLIQKGAKEYTDKILSNLRQLSNDHERGLTLNKRTMLASFAKAYDPNYFSKVGEAFDDELVFNFVLGEVSLERMGFESSADYRSEILSPVSMSYLGTRGNKVVIRNHSIRSPKEFFSPHTFFSNRSPDIEVLYIPEGTPHKKAVNYRNYIRNQSKSTVYFLITNKKVLRWMGYPKYTDVNELPHQPQPKNTNEGSSSSKLIHHRDGTSLYDDLNTPVGNPVYVYVVKGQGYNYHTLSIPVMDGVEIRGVITRMHDVINSLISQDQLDSSRKYIPVVVKKSLSQLQKFNRDRRFVPLRRFTDQLNKKMTEYYQAKASGFLGFYNDFVYPYYFTERGESRKEEIEINLMDFLEKVFHSRDLKHTHLYSLFTKANSEFGYFRHKFSNNNGWKDIEKVLRSVVGSYYERQFKSTSYNHMMCPSIDAFAKDLVENYSMILSQRRSRFDPPSPLLIDRLEEYINLVERCGSNTIPSEEEEGE